MLLDHFETDLEGTIYEEDADRHLVEVNLFDGLLQVYIKLGWKKLDKSYTLLTSAAHVGAVIFHLCKNWSVLDQLWSSTINFVKDEYRNGMRAIWEV
jgi:hypothetical protein